VCREGWSATNLPSAKEAHAGHHAAGAAEHHPPSACSSQAGSIGKLASRRRRQAWVQSLQQLLDSASPSASASQFAHPQWEAPLLVRTTVVEACRPDLLAIKGALVDTRQHISAATLRQRKRFVTDPSGSPLFGGDPIIAQRAARDLQRCFTGHPAP
jgi:hypothetical protein